VGKTKYEADASEEEIPTYTSSTLKQIELIAWRSRYVGIVFLYVFMFECMNVQICSKYLL